MPFDSIGYDAPRVETQDDVLRWLIALREFHSDPANWCAGTGENGAYGDARCIIRATGDLLIPFKRVEPYLRAALPPHLHGLGGIVRFNEMSGTTHAQLMAFYDRAIAARRAEVSHG